LLTCGFKTIPKYNFFELLSFTVERFTEQSFADFLQDNSELDENYQAYLNSQKEQFFTINQTILNKFVSSQTPQQKQIFKALNLQDLINEQIRQELAGYQLTSTETYTPVTN